MPCMATWPHGPSPPRFKDIAVPTPLGGGKSMVSGFFPPKPSDLSDSLSCNLLDALSPSLSPLSSHPSSTAMELICSSTRLSHQRFILDWATAKDSCKRSEQRSTLRSAAPPPQGPSGEGEIVVVTDPFVFGEGWAFGGPPLS